MSVRHGVVSTRPSAPSTTDVTLVVEAKSVLPASEIESMIFNITDAVELRRACELQISSIAELLFLFALRRLSTASAYDIVAEPTLHGYPLPQNVQEVSQYALGARDVVGKAPGVGIRGIHERRRQGQEAGAFGLVLDVAYVNGNHVLELICRELLRFTLDASHCR